MSLITNGPRDISIHTISRSDVRVFAKAHLVKDPPRLGILCPGFKLPRKTVSNESGRPLRVDSSSSHGATSANMQKPAAKAPVFYARKAKPTLT